MDENILTMTDRLSKYIRFKKEIYILTIYKNDWDGNNNAWIMMYAKESESTISKKKTLLKVEGSTFPKALEKMCVALNNFKAENRGNPDITKM